MRNCIAISLVLVCFALSGCRESTPDAFATADYDEQEMIAAIAQARSEVDSFISELSNPTGTGHAVKAPIKDGDATEYFWIIDLSYTNGEFEGTINNDPRIVGNVRFGQKWAVKKDEISDWMFMKDGRMHGNYTLRPLLKSMPEDEAERLREMLAEP